MKIKVLIKNVGEPIREAEIENSLTAMQEVVGGYIEAVYLTSHICFICNEEGKLDGLETNFIWDKDIIVGNVFFTRLDDNGDNISLTDIDIKIIKKLMEKA